MSSIGARIWSDAIAKLNASSLKPSGSTAERGRNLQAVSVPSTLVYVRNIAKRRAQGRASTPLQTCIALIEVEFRVKGLASANPFDIADPFLLWATAAIDGVRLDGGFDPAVETGVVITEDASTSSPFVLAVVSFEELYTQRVGDATRLS